MAEKDEQRHEEFKQYEMQKKYEEEQKMKGNTGKRRKHNVLRLLTFINI